MKHSLHRIHHTHLIYQGGLSWIEFIITTLLVALLSAIAIPKFFNYDVNAKISTTQSILLSVRSDISNYLTQTKMSGIATFPTFVQINTAGVVFKNALLPNPFIGNPQIRNAKGEWEESNPPIYLPTKEGWNYDEDTGKFWANSALSDENKL